LPTGAGKSLLYQFPSVIIDKPIICISPLISLMADQKAHLDEFNIPSIDYNSTQKNKIKIKEDILDGKYKIVFMTPEYIIKASNFLIEINEKIGIGAFAIDEAHCISSQGHNFRSAYRELGCINTIFPKIPIVALTGTATKTVQKDIIKQLGMENPKIFRQSHDRINLTYYIKKKINMSTDLTQLISADEFIIIYCQTKKNTEKIAEFVKSLNIKCDRYHAGLDDDLRADIQNNFMIGKLTCVVCTLSFGMGIDKSNIRKVIHYGAPKDLESYCQEVGRAGRDGKHSDCYLFYNEQDFVINRLLIGHGDNYEHITHKQNLLNTFIKFLKTNNCKRKFILDYFDDDTDINNKLEKCCNICINKNDNVDKIIKNIDITEDCQLIIKLIQLISEKSCTTSMIINMVRGSNNKKITSYMKTLYGYGLGKKYSSEQWKIILDHLIACKLLTEKTVMWRMQYTIILVSNKGREFLSDDTKINIDEDLLNIKSAKKTKKTTKTKADNKTKKSLTDSDSDDTATADSDNKKITKTRVRSDDKKNKTIMKKTITSDDTHSSDSGDGKITKLEPLKNKKPNVDVDRTLKLFTNKYTVDEISLKLNKNVGVIESYLCDIVKNGKDIDFSRLNLSSKKFSDIKDVIDYEFEGRTNNIAEIKEKCVKNTSYYEIKMTMAIIDSNQINKILDIEKTKTKTKAKTETKTKHSTSASSESSEDMVKLPKTKPKTNKKKYVSVSASDSD